MSVLLLRIQTLVAPVVHQNVVLTNLSVGPVSKAEERLPVSKKEISPCPIDAMLSVVDGRWKGTILWLLSEGPMRTSELRRGIPPITERMLIRHLQELVSDGILVRREERRVPPCVRYSISDYGWTLVPVLETICAWGRIHLKRTCKVNQRRSVSSRPHPSERRSS